MQDAHYELFNFKLSNFSLKLPFPECLTRTFSVMQTDPPQTPEIFYQGAMKLQPLKNLNLNFGRFIINSLEIVIFQ